MFLKSKASKRKKVNLFISGEFTDTDTRDIIVEKH